MYSSPRIRKSLTHGIPSLPADSRMILKDLPRTTRTISMHRLHLVIALRIEGIINSSRLTHSRIAHLSLAKNSESVEDKDSHK